MQGRISGIRYGEVVFEIARESNQLEKWRDDLEKITDVMHNVEMKDVLENPKIPFEKKEKIISACLGGVGAEGLNLAYLLVTKDKIKIASLIEEEYKRLLDEHLGIERANVVTAVPIDDKEKEKLKQNLETLTRQKIIADFKVDSNIVGGVVVKIKDKLIDGSIKNKLEVLKKSIVLH